MKILAPCFITNQNHLYFVLCSVEENKSNGPSVRCSCESYGLLIRRSRVRAPTISLASPGISGTCGVSGFRRKMQNIFSMPKICRMFVGVLPRIAVKHLSHGQRIRCFWPGNRRLPPGFSPPRRPVWGVSRPS